LEVHILSFIAREDVGSGIPRYTYQLIRNLLKIAPDINIYVSEYGSNPPTAFQRWIKRSLFAFKTLNVDADIHHAVTPHLAWPLMLTLKHPVIVTVHDLFPLYRDLYRISKLEFHVAKQILRYSSLILTTAYYWKKELTKHFRIAPDKIIVAHVGVDLEKFKPMNIVKDEKKKIALYVGGLTKEKGLDILLLAMKYVVKRLPKAELWVVGKGPHESYFKKLAEKLGIAKHVRFLGFAPENKLPWLYNFADVFVYPSRTAFGLMLLEAMACGTPVIAFKRFQVPEYLGEAAILVEYLNIKALGKSILSVLTDDSLRQELRKRGLNRVKYFTWDRTAKITYKAYRKLT